MKLLKNVILIFAASVLTSNAAVRLPAIFSDGMVLQQQSTVKLWGWAEKGSTVSVSTSWDGRDVTAVPADDGRFTAEVATPAAGGPYSIVITEKAGRKKSSVSLTDVYIGEVWLCSGQSNMEMNMKGYKGQPVEGAAEALLQCTDADLHLFTVGHSTTFTPQTDVKGQWATADITTVRNFSATAYFFGRALRRALGVPVGLIVTSYGGSCIEAWMKAEWLTGLDNIYIPQNEDDVKRLKQYCHTALYNGQLSPLVGYGIKGFTWYQGETNVTRPYNYATLMQRMVQGWREEWQQADLPFFYCQIAPFDYSTMNWKHSEIVREQQMKAEAMIPNARMAVLMDAGLHKGIHPRKKRQAGERLAMLALAHAYGVKGLPEYAVYSSVQFRGDTAVVAFDRSKEWVYFESSQRSSNFEIAGDDRKFHPAEAWIERNRVLVHSDAVKHPVAVRYAFHDWAEGDLMHDGLPVSSFRTDDWSVE